MEPSGETQDPVRPLREVLAYANSFVEVFDDEVEFSDGTQGQYLRICHSADGNGVVILPFCNGSVGLVRTYRYPLGAWQWGLPRGFAHDPDPLVTARIELREELGVTALDFRIVGMFTPDSGLLASRVTVVLAIINDPFGYPEDKREVAEVRWVPVRDLWALLADGKVEDGMTLAALALAKATDVLASI